MESVTHPLILRPVMKTHMATASGCKDIPQNHCVFRFKHNLTRLSDLLDLICYDLHHKSTMHHKAWSHAYSGFNHNKRQALLKPFAKCTPQSMGLSSHFTSAISRRPKDGSAFMLECNDKHDIEGNPLLQYSMTAWMNNHGTPSSLLFPYRT